MTRSMIVRQWPSRLGSKVTLGGVLLASGLCVLGCEQATDPRTEEDGALRPTSETASIYGVDRAPETAVSIQWEPVARSAWSTPQSMLKLLVSNTTDEPQDATVVLVASQDTAPSDRISLGQVTLAAGERRELEIPVASLLPAADGIAAVTVEASYSSLEGEVVVVASDTLYYDRPSTDSSQARVFPLEGLSGRVRTIDLDSLPDPVDYLGTPDGLDDSEIARRGLPGARFRDQTRRVKLCTTWKALYTDAAFGQDIDATPGLQDIPARYAGASILAKGITRPVWRGYLDGAGCTPVVDLPVGDYVLTRSTRVSRDGVSMSVTKMVNGAQAGLQFDTAFTVTLLTPEDTTFSFHPIEHDSATRATAAAGAVLAQMDAGIPVGSYRIKTDQGCPVGGYACYNPDPYDEAVYLAEANTYWKNIIAHEIGHHVQDRAIGTLRINYDTVPTMNPSATNPGACGCDQVVDPTARSHCLGSSETMTSALVEGFAHFFASRTYNNNTPTDNDCRFVYYKEAYLYSPQIAGQQWSLATPPVSISCHNPQQWLETHCLEQNKGVEWDWQIFFWNLTRAGSTYCYLTHCVDVQYTLSDVWSVFNTACGNTTCDTWDLHWSELASGAADTWGGAASPKARAWTGVGAYAGVDN